MRPGTEGYPDPCRYTLGIISPPDLALPLFGPGIALLDDQNPLKRQSIIKAVVRGGVGDYDNVHITNMPYVSLPVPIPPGCPECFHMHWRWGAAFGPDYGNGLPFVKQGSNQDVLVALVNASGPEDAQFSGGNWNLASFSRSPLSDPVEWYLATAYQATDTIDMHGAFFAENLHDRNADLRINPFGLALLGPQTYTATSVKSGTTVTYPVLLHNYGPYDTYQSAFDVSLPIGASYTPGSTKVVDSLGNVFGNGLGPGTISFIPSNAGKPARLHIDFPFFNQAQLTTGQDYYITISIPITLNTVGNNNMFASVVGVDPIIDPDQSDNQFNISTQVTP